VIKIHIGDHNPPDFHALFAEHEATFGIDRIRLLHGSLPHRAESLAIEWAALHQDELRLNWERAQRRIPLVPIDPLP
jgi:hypothetical protein